MITDISIHDVQKLEIRAERLPSPAAEWTTVKIKIGARSLEGRIEWQVVNLFFSDTERLKFEDTELARNITAFNRPYAVEEL